MRLPAQRELQGREQEFREFRSLNVGFRILNEKSQIKKKETRVTSNL